MNKPLYNLKDQKTDLRGFGLTLILALFLTFKPRFLCCELSALVMLAVTSLTEAYGQSVKVTSPPFSSKFIDAITSY